MRISQVKHYELTGPPNPDNWTETCMICGVTVTNEDIFNCDCATPTGNIDHVLKKLKDVSCTDLPGGKNAKRTSK
jgi:hypothetical protein